MTCIPCVSCISPTRFFSRSITNLTLAQNVVCIEKQRKTTALYLVPKSFGFCFAFSTCAVVDGCSLDESLEICCTLC